MRRALLAVLAGGTLLAGAACDSDANTTAGVAVPSAPAPSSAPPSSVAPPDFSANTRLVCGRLQGIYQTELRDLGAAMGKMITYKEAKQAAEAQKATAAKIRKETGAARDPEFKAAGVVSARKLELSAKDRRYFDRVKTLNDLNRTIEGQLTEWLTPVAGYCGAA
jgi:crotonobetainyl-CoA:carnitine CoA-transferase CaiB-like acyl-CoA transferase